MSCLELLLCATLQSLCLGESAVSLALSCQAMLCRSNMFDNMFCSVFRRSTTLAVVAGEYFLFNKLPSKSCMVRLQCISTAPPDHGPPCLTVILHLLEHRPTWLACVHT